VTVNNPMASVLPDRAIPVVTADESRALDAATIATLGGDSARLMQQAALAIADWYVAECDVHEPVAIYTGPGNNGGDGWMVAALLRARGIPVRVLDVMPPRTPDAIGAREEAVQGGAFEVPTGAERIALDALVGSGGSVRTTPELQRARDAMRRHERRIAIDLPSGLDASTGDADGVVATHTTLALGSVKRGHLLTRDVCGEIVVLDIGLDEVPPLTPTLARAAWLPMMTAPALTSRSHKGERGRVQIIGGSDGMAGAAILAARAAHVSGAGLVHATVSAASTLAMQTAAPFATTSVAGAATERVAWAPAHARVIGPGLATGPLPAWWNAVVHESLPMVLDAGALRLLADTDGSAQNAAWILTPHAGEAQALLGELEGDTFASAARIARRCGCYTLAKGVPTVITGPDGQCVVSARGNLALATGGSGDLLAGIIGALLAQGFAPLLAAALAALAHGCAAESVVAERGGWRGVASDDLLDAVARQWNTPRTLRPGVLETLPALPRA
jgi:ADP-dependent NAD(P)H-hydrate dehydratase / NAD(P)H-hydrate epimerase